MLLLLVCFSVMLPANNSGSTINNLAPVPPYYVANSAGSTINDVLIIPYVADDPVIDGVLDAAWNFPDVGMFVYVDNDLPEGGATDLSTLYRVAWNEDGLYFFGRVIDDTINTGLANAGENDCWEIYFDGDNRKSSSYDDNDIQWRWVHGRTDIDSGWADAGEWAWVETERGYDFELMISAENLVKEGNPLFYLEEGTIIGWEAQVADNDTGARDCISKWWSNSNESDLHPYFFGTAKLGGFDPTLELLTLEHAPIIDGELDAEWDSIPEFAMTSITDQNLPDGGYADFSSFYRAAWDADAFYFFGRVVDDVIYTAGTNPWEQDCWEIYFDGGNEKASSYDNNDIFWRWVYGKTEIESEWADVGEWAWLETYNGYNFELMISAENLVKGENPLFALEEGHEIGWEVQVADNDAGTRDCISKWWSNSNESYLHPYFFGTARLTSFGGIAETVSANITLFVPSIQINSIANISYTIAARNSVKLRLYNLAGQEVESLVDGVKSAGTHTVSLDASGLANGVYLCRLEACNGVSTKKITLIK